MRWGWGSPRVVGLFAGGIVLLAALVRWELRVPAPLVDMRLARLRGVWTVYLGGSSAAFGMLIMFLLVPKLSQTPRASGYGFGDSVTRASLYLLPMALLMLLASPVAGVLAARIGSRAVALWGAVAAVAGFADLALLHHTSLDLIIGSAVLGVGIGFNLTSCANLVSLAAPHAQIGEANGMSTMLRTAGAALGAQVAATIVSSFAAPHAPWPDDRGYTISFAVAAGGGVVSFLAMLFNPQRREAVEADRAAAAWHRSA